ncbi:transposable element Tcb1 transposase [Trichonephila clavipes]|uniref:Transposable element Tcb1 transposase n=1 Tax=Trichonephila clavipes TaxID=2585209 RepID=A0A8X6SZH8_TRICX|nr:transposable element Tcb1 transposase [Trichonephila clavipes]
MEALLVDCSYICWGPCTIHTAVATFLLTIHIDYLYFRFAFRSNTREIGSRVGRNRTTVMRICHRCMQEGTTDRLGRSHPHQCTTSYEDRQIVRMAVTDLSVTSRTVAQPIEYATHHSVSARTIRRRLQQSGLSARRPLLGLLLTQNLRRLRRQCQRYISEVLEPVVLPYLQGLATAIFQQDNALPHVARIVQRFFVNHHIELLPWPARSPDLSPIENMRSMIAQRLTQIDQINFGNVWKLLGLLYPIQGLLESIPRRVTALISKNAAILILLILAGTTLHRSL